MSTGRPTKFARGEQGRQAAQSDLLALINKSRERAVATRAECAEAIRELEAGLLRDGHLLPSGRPNHLLPAMKKTTVQETARER